MNPICGCNVINGVMALCDLHRFQMADPGMFPRMYLTQPMANMFQQGQEIARYFFNFQAMNANNYPYQFAPNYFGPQEQPIRVNNRNRAGWNEQNVVYAEGDEEGAVEEVEGDEEHGRIEELVEEQEEEQAALNDEEAEDEEEEGGDGAPQDPVPVVAPRAERFDIINDVLVVRAIKISKDKSTQTNFGLEEEEGEGEGEGEEENANGEENDGENGEDDVARPQREASPMIPNIRAYYRELVGTNFNVDIIMIGGGRVELKYDHCQIRYGTEIIENSEKKKQIFAQLGENPLLNHDLFAMVELTFPETRKRRADNTPANSVFTRVLIEEDGEN